MSRPVYLLLAIAMLSAVLCNPIMVENNGASVQPSHSLWKRFINPALSYGGMLDGGISKMRTKRQSEEDCEKLQLCKLHARSQRNFFSAFQLYFVNKENARLWDHQTHSIADCHRRFGNC